MVGRRNGGGRGWRIGLAAGAVAFLCQMLAWAWYPPVAAADGMVIPICSTDGLTYRSVPVDAGTPAKDGAFGKANHGCPLCPLVNSLSLPPPLAGIASPVELARHGSAGLPGQHIAAGWFLSTLQARAPPVG